MKKIIKSIVSIALILIMCVTMTGCGSIIRNHTTLHANGVLIEWDGVTIRNDKQRNYVDYCLETDQKINIELLQYMGEES